MVYNIYMANIKNTYPEWAEKFREKGKTIRKVKDGYALYRCTSEYVKGQKYPKAKQEYLGMITEKEGFIPKRADAPNPVYLEYGLSKVIRANFRREVMRHTCNFTDEIFWLGIIGYIFGSTERVCLERSSLTYGVADRLEAIRDKIRPEKITKVSELIAEKLETKIPDMDERSLVRNLLMLCVVEAKPGAIKPQIPEKVRDILKKSGLRYED